MRFLGIGLLFFGCCSAFAADLPGQWYVRDVAANSGWKTNDEHGDVPDLQLQLKWRSNPVKPWSSSCTVIDTSGRERAVTIAYILSTDLTGWTWHDDPEHTRLIDGDKTFANLSDKCGGVNDSASLYPFAVISHGATATVLGAPVTPPRLPRFVYDPKAKELRAEFDFGLSKDVAAFPSRADASVIIYEVPAKWAFRQAIAKYWELYPEAFARRAKRAGIWMPFGDLRGVQGAEDFGFGYHEFSDIQLRDPKDGKAMLNRDEQVGAMSYVYVEPPTYWQYFKGEGRGNYEQRLAQLRSDAEAGDRMSQATLVSGIIRDNGQRDLYLQPVAYTPQAPWGSNADPHIPDDAKKGWPSKANYEFKRVEEALGLHGHPDLGADGVYVDSMEGWGEILNYNRAHWRVSQYPLTFDPKSHRVALLNFWGTVEWVKQMSERSHSRGQLLMGNDAYFRRWQLAPYVDVPGREYTWITKDMKFDPVPDGRYLFFKTMSGAKPYLMLMNNRYEAGEFMEPYMQRSLFFAVFPSMFQGHASTHDVSYFDNPEWYNRDRALFKKYVPLIRKVDEAGWKPVPFASAEPNDIRIERYGEAAKKNLAFTVHNPTEKQVHAVLKLDRDGLMLPATFSAEEWIRGEKLTVSGDSIKLHLPAKGYAAAGIQ
ncbi:MAG TPA: hypothetical protein VL282_09065 [Tepidisphaeraceae bacterium]|jgi:hypothetical protein|nr:hypothetical protein [Tepidisphaeraceae bacterium]